MDKLYRLFGILCVVALLTLAAGCGGGSGTTGGTSSAGGESGGGGQSTVDAGGTGEATADGSESKQPETQSEAKTRQEVKKIVDAKMREFGLSSDQIACVDENIATMTPQELSAGVTRPSGAETAEAEEETVENYLGPLAKGCL